MLSLLFPLLLTGCNRDAPPDTAPPDQDGVLRVVIVVMDGVRMEESFGDGTSDLTGEATADFLPRIRADLVPLGTLIVPAYQLGVTATGPGHAQLLTGRRIRYGQYPTGADDLPGIYVPEVPGLFQALSGDGPGLAVGNTFHVNPTTHSIYPGADAAPDWVLVKDENDDVSSDDMDVVQAFIDGLDAQSPVVSLLNLHTADNLGHQSADPLDYVGGILDQDAAVPRVWSAIQSRAEYAGRTLLVITSDHGRHRGDAGTFQDHGDECSGCREVPILLIGPGVEAGLVIDTPHALIDIAPTIAALAGAEMPFAEGLPITGALTDASVVARSGLTEPAILTVGERTVEAWVTYGDEPLARTVLTVDGEVFSSSDAVEAREPVLFEFNGDVGVCWRELLAEDGIPGAWVGRCMVEIDGWQDIGFPADAVSPYFRPAISWDGSALWAVYRDGANGRVVTPGREPIGVAAAQWRPGEGWQVAPSPPLSTCFPVTPVGVATEAGHLSMAIAGSEDGDGRFDRRIFLSQLSWEKEALLEESTSFLIEGYTRQELPAIQHRDGITSVAFVACGEDDCGLARTDNDGTGWSEPVVLDAVIFPHIGPSWGPDGALYWGRPGASGAEVCRDTEADCQAVGSERLGALTGTASGAVVTVDAGVGQWERADLTW